MEIKAETAGRADVVLARHLSISRSHAKKIIENGSAIKPSAEMAVGDVFYVEIPEPQVLEAIPENIKLDIVYEDADLLIVNKPRGMVVHAGAGNKSGTLVNALLAHCGEELSGINGTLRPGIVHRIDKDTTGLLIVAKTNPAHLSLAAQIKEHTLTRGYLAIVHGNIKEEGVVDAPIGRNPKNRKKMAVVSGGRSAITHYAPRKTLTIRGQTHTLVECRLKTGRTHQIRVHMSHIGHPVLGDPIYGAKGGKGQLLHAYLLGFVHPTTGEYMEFKSAPPEEFVKLAQLQ